MNVSKANLLYAFSCCGYMVLFEQPPGTYLTCPICFWQDIEVSPSYLRIAQRHFLEFGACDRQYSNKVRSPTAEDQRVLNW